MRQLGHDMNEAKVVQHCADRCVASSGAGKAVEFFHSSRGKLGNAAIEQAANQGGNVETLNAEALG